MDKRYKFNPDEKLEIILTVMKNPKKQKELLGKYGMGIATYYKWRNRFLHGGIAALKYQKPGTKPLEKGSNKEKELQKKLTISQNRINELSTELEILKKKENWNPEE